MSVSPTMPSSAEPSLPQTQSASVVTYNITKFCWFYITMQEYIIHADAASTKSWSILMYFCFSVGDKPSLVRYAEIDIAIKPQYLISMGNIWVVQPFCTHCSFPAYVDVHSQYFLYKGLLSLLELTDQITRSKHKGINIFSSKKLRWHSKTTMGLQCNPQTIRNCAFWEKKCPCCFLLSQYLLVVFKTKFYWHFCITPLYLQHLVMSPHVAFQWIFIISENMFESSSLPTCIAPIKSFDFHNCRLTSIGRMLSTAFIKELSLFDSICLISCHVIHLSLIFSQYIYIYIYIYI